MLLILLEEEIMLPSLFHSQPKFLLDENVKKELLRFLNSEGYDVDFTDTFLYPKDKIFSVVWLRIPQDKPKALLESFSILLKDKSKPEDFEGFLIELREDGSFKSSPIPSKEDLTK